jgi:hypothetical protein
MSTFHKLLCSIAFMLLCLNSTYALAEAEATLTEVTGTVLINQGKNYVAGQSGMKLDANTRVFSKEKSSAVIVSKQGCVTRLEANSLYVVKPVDPCHGGLAAQKLDAGGIGAISGSSGASLASASATSTGWLSGTTGLVVAGAGGVAVVTGGVVGGLAASGGLSPNGSAIPPACISPTSPECAASF